MSGHVGIWAEATTVPSHIGILCTILEERRN